MPRLRLALPIAIGALAVASLIAPFEPVYDPWAWLVWGREVVHFDLDTTSGPSWKPLPVIATTLFAPAGSAAPDLWLVVARAGWLAAAALAWRLAARLAFQPRSALAAYSPQQVRRARILAGALAAVGVLLLFDPFTSWVRQFAAGLSEPLLVALVLGAIDRDLEGRRGQALLLGVAAALLRPEAWPLLLLYGAVLWRREPWLRRWLVVAGVAVPLLWIVPDLIGSGSPLTGASRAREATGAPPVEAVEAIGRSLELVLAALWVGAVYAVVSARRGRERAIQVLAAGAVAWIAIVAALAAAGYAGLPRFAAPAGAVGCVLGAVGAVRLVADARVALRAPGRGPAAHGRMLAATAAVLLIGFAVQGALRAAEVPEQVERAARDGRAVERLFELVDDAGPRRPAACDTATTTDFYTETALAWKLDLPLSEIGTRIASAPGSGLAILDPDAGARARHAVHAAGRPIARHARWQAYAISCAARASSASDRAMAGVSGDRR